MPSCLLLIQRSKQLPEGELVYNGIEEKRGRVLDLFSPQLLQSTLIIWFLWVSNVLVYYGIVLLTPGIPCPDKP